MIVIPMAGLSSRFFKAGFKKPKYMLEARGLTLFEHSVRSFSKYFDTEKFLFIVRNVYDTYNFVNNKCRDLGIANYEIVIIDSETRGQAETVAVGLKLAKIDSGPLSIFNIDTFRPGFEYPKFKNDVSGFLEVFIGDGDNWSFIELDDHNPDLVRRTTEKIPISNYCCTGFYNFRSVNDFMDAYNYYLSIPDENWPNGELYVAPLFNHLIKKGKKIGYSLINKNKVVFCGIPKEYEAFQNQIE